MAMWWWVKAYPDSCTHRSKCLTESCIQNFLRSLENLDKKKTKNQKSEQQSEHHTFSNNCRFDLIDSTLGIKCLLEMVSQERIYSQLTLRVTVSSVLMLFLKVTSQVTLERCWVAAASNISVEMCFLVTPVPNSVLTPVMLSAMWESSFPLPFHFQVISGSDPEQRPGAVQVSVALCPSVSGGTVTVGFWLRADQKAVNY